VTVVVVAAAAAVVAVVSIARRQSVHFSTVPFGWHCTEIDE
jgi:hypothetical protein